MTLSIGKEEIKRNIIIKKRKLKDSNRFSLLILIGPISYRYSPRKSPLRGT